MNTVAILVSHFESWPLLKGCIEAIKRTRNAGISQRVYIVDDDSRDGSRERAESTWCGDPEVSILRFRRRNKGVPDAGQLLDRALSVINESHVALIHVDTFPISRDWLSYPIYLLRRHACSVVGCETGQSTCYLDKVAGRWENASAHGSQPHYGLLSNEYFTCINHLYWVSSTETATTVSKAVGFKRHSTLSNKVISRLLPHRWTNLLRRRGVLPFPNADNDVRANYFIDANRLGPKFALPITGFVGRTPTLGVFGQNVLGLVLHFSLSRTMIRSYRHSADPGEDYRAVAERLLAEGVTESFLEYLIRQTELPGHEFGSSLEQHALILKAFRHSFDEYRALRS